MSIAATEAVARHRLNQAQETLIEATKQASDLIKWAQTPETEAHTQVLRANLHVTLTDHLHMIDAARLKLSGHQEPAPE